MKLADWLQQLPRRRQIALLAVAAALLLGLLLAVLAGPLTARHSAAALRNQQLAAQLLHVQALSSELQQLKRAGAGPGSKNINQLINQSTARFGIVPNRIQPDSRGETRIRFDEISYAALLRWLYHMEKVELVVLREVSIVQAVGAGSVKATVRLGRGGAT